MSLVTSVFAAVASLVPSHQKEHSFSANPGRIWRSLGGLCHIDLSLAWARTKKHVLGCWQEALGDKMEPTISRELFWWVCSHALFVEPPAGLLWNGSFGPSEPWIHFVHDGMMSRIALLDLIYAFASVWVIKCNVVSSCGSHLSRKEGVQESKLRTIPINPIFGI